jgi:hypothetical protein
MTTPTTPRAWLGLLLGHLTTDAALRAAGEALACADASRYAACLARCGANLGAIDVHRAHAAVCDQHGAVLLPVLPVPAPSMQAADRLLRELHRPALLTAVVGTWDCEQTLDAAVACHVLNGRSFVSRDLLLEHVQRGCSTHGRLVTLLEARALILDRLEQMDRGDHTRVPE